MNNNPARKWSVALLAVSLLCLAFFIARGEEAVQASQPHSLISVQLNDSKPDTSLVAVPEPSAKAHMHYRSGLVLLGAFILWTPLLPALFLFTGLSARMRSWAERLGRKWYFIFALYGLAFGLVYYLVSLPLSYYAGFVRPHSYDLSNQTLGRWLGNYIKGATVTILIGLAVGWIPFLLIKKSPCRWWLYLGLMAPPLLCVMQLLQPVLIEPLYYKFQPLQNKALESKILAQATRAGIEGSRVYEVNQSVDTRTLNAYVAGFMGTKRIVFWDTILKTLDEDELLFILGHEMGHFMLRHIIKSIAFSSVLILLSLYAVHLLAARSIARFNNRFGFIAMSDFAALPLGLLLIQIITFVGLPVPMAFSRHLEHEADRFGLELTHNNRAAATAFAKIQQENLGIPRPGTIPRIWLFTHPSIGERIDFFNSYSPWESGQPSHYEEYFKR